MNRRWSARRASIESRRGELTQQFQHDHGRPPTQVEMIHLAQQATLETRDAKHEPRGLSQQRTSWRAEAAQVLGGPQAVDAMVHAALPPATKITSRTDTDWIAAAADRVLTAIEEHRSTWQIWHVRAESTTPNPRRQPDRRQARAAGRAARRRSAHSIDIAHIAGRCCGTGAVAAVRWLIGLNPRRCRAFHLGPNPRC